MKIKKGRQVLSLFLVMSLSLMMIAPMVSANDEPFNEGINPSEGIKKYLTAEELEKSPVHESKIFDLRTLADPKTSPELNDRPIEFIYSVFEEKDLIDQTNKRSGGLISVTIPKSSVKYMDQQPGSPAFIPDNLLTTSIKTDIPVFILWAPKNMIESSEKEDSIILTFPEELLMEYKDISEAKKSIAASREVNLQLTSDTMPPAEAALLSQAATSRGDFDERSKYADENCEEEINGVTGKIYPSTSYNYGESYFSYHEIEICLSRPPYTTYPDTIEFISYHRTDNQKRAFVAMWDEGAPYTLLDIDATSVTYLEYYFYIENSAGWVYWMHFRDPSTGTWYTNSWNDSDNPSYYVKDLRGSTELKALQHVPPIYSFYTSTTLMRVDWTRTTSGWFTPRQTLLELDGTPNEPYVKHTASWNGDGIDTSHQCGSGVA